MIEYWFDYLALPTRYFDNIFESISILCRPLVVRKVFLMVAIVVLTNHSLNVLNTKAAVASPLILTWIRYKFSHNKNTIQKHPSKESDGYNFLIHNANSWLFWLNNWFWKNQETASGRIGKSFDGYLYALHPIKHSFPLYKALLSDYQPDFFER